MDLNRLEMLADFVDCLDNFAALGDKLVAVVMHDQMLDLVEKLVNCSMVDSLVVDDLDYRIFDSDRFHGHCTYLTDYMRDCSYCSYYHGYSVAVCDLPWYCLVLDSNWHLYVCQKQKEEKETERKRKRDALDVIQ